MKIISIGLDVSVLQQDSPSAKRQVANYAGWEAELLVLGTGASVIASLSSNVISRRCGGTMKLISLIRTMIIARRCVRRFRPDLVTVQDPLWSGLVGWIAVSGTSTPLHVQDHSGILGRKPFGMVEFFLRPFSRLLLRTASRVRTVSERGARGLRQAGVSAECIDVYPIATDLSPFLTLERIQPPVPTVVTIARLEKEKGIDDLLRAFQMVHEEIPQAKLEIVGSGSRQKNLERLADELGIASSVIFHGHQENVVSLLSHASVYVQPSCFEGYGIAVLEAAASACPIVMADVGCAGELIVDGVSGSVVPSRVPSVLAQSIRNLLQDPIRAKEFGAYARVSATSFPKASQIVECNRTSLETTSRSIIDRLPFLSTFFTALFVRFGLLILLLTVRGSSALWFPDTDQYGGIASSLVQGHGFMLNGVLTDFRPPLYPLLMALGLFVHFEIFVVFLQLFLSAGLPAMSALIARELGLSSRATRLGMWLIVFEPHLLFYSVPYLTDALLTFTFLLMVLLLMRGFRRSSEWMWVGAGCALGLNLLLKPAFQLVPFALVIATALCVRTQLKHVLIFFLVTLMMVSPWLLRNQVRFQSLTLNRQGAQQALFYLGTSIESTATGQEYALTEKNIEERFIEKYGILERSDRYLPESIGIMRLYPFATVRVIVVSFISFWTSQDISYLFHHYGLIPMIDRSVSPPTHYLVQGNFKEFANVFLRIFSQPFYAIGAVGRLFWLVINVLMVFGGYVVFKKLPASRGVLGLVLFLALIYSATVAINGLGIVGRLRLPFIPLQLLFMAVAVDSWKKRVL